LDRLIGIFRKQADADENNPEYRYALGHCLYYKEDYRGALDEFDGILKVDRNSINALLGKSCVLSTSRDEKIRDGLLALKLAERAGVLVGDNGAVYLLYKAYALAECGQIGAAIKVATAARKLGERGSRLSRLCDQTIERLEKGKKIRLFE
jgi:tetratricopeptide (TPR) repeat protein